MSEFAWTQEQRVDMERHDAVRRALDWILDAHEWPDPSVPLDTAVAVLLDSVHKQLRWSE